LKSDWHPRCISGMMIRCLMPGLASPWARLCDSCILPQRMVPCLISFVAPWPLCAASAHTLPLRSFGWLSIWAGRPSAPRVRPGQREKEGVDAQFSAIQAPGTRPVLDHRPAGSRAIAAAGPFFEIGLAAGVCRTSSAVGGGTSLLRSERRANVGSHSLGKFMRPSRSGGGPMRVACESILPRQA